MHRSVDMWSANPESRSAAFLLLNFKMLAKEEMDALLIGVERAGGEVALNPAADFIFQADGNTLGVGWHDDLGITFITGVGIGDRKHAIPVSCGGVGTDHRERRNPSSNRSKDPLAEISQSRHSPSTR